MKTIDGIKIFEFEEDYTGINSIGDIIEIEEGVFGLVEEKLSETDEIKLRILVNCDDRNNDANKIIDDLLDELCDNPDNKSAKALIEYFNQTK